MLKTKFREIKTLPDGLSKADAYKNSFVLGNKAKTVKIGMKKLVATTVLVLIFVLGAYFVALFQVANASPSKAEFEYCFEFNVDGTISCYEPAGGAPEVLSSPFSPLGTMDVPPPTPGYTINAYLNADRSLLYVEVCGPLPSVQITVGFINLINPDGHFHSRYKLGLKPGLYGGTSIIELSSF